MSADFSPGVAINQKVETALVLLSEENIQSVVRFYFLCVDVYFPVILLQLWSCCFLGKGG